MYISIVIPVYNRPEEIKELIESLLISNYSKEFEIVIVEDGSSITCEKEVEEYIIKILTKIPFIQKKNHLKFRWFSIRYYLKTIL